MEMTDLAPKEAWERLEREIHDRYPLNAAVFDGSGKRVTDWANWCNPLCPVVKGRPQSLSQVCATANQAALAAGRAGEPPRAMECDAGLAKLCLPVRAKGEFVGLVGGCGALFEDAEVESWMLSRLTEMDEAEIAKLAAQAPRLTRDQAREALEWIAARVEELTGCPQARPRDAEA